MSLVNVLISLASGAIGGNAAGAAMKDKSLGTVGNSLSGILGGGIGGAILHLLHVGTTSGGGVDMATILSHFATGGVGGAVLMIIISLLRGPTSRAA
jgi:uncharacterized membrane protein YeaQ/YmgE (transglycosylase-associated protein family)